MANIKSAKKRILQNLKRSEINKTRKSKIRSKIKSINIGIEKKIAKDVRKDFLNLESEIAKAANKGVLKKNAASRIVSRLSRKIRVLK